MTEDNIGCLPRLRGDSPFYSAIFFFGPEKRILISDQGFNIFNTRGDIFWLSFEVNTTDPLLKSKI
jgi:hypothetical protein